MRTFLSNVLSITAGNAVTLVANLIFSLVLVARLNDAELGLQGAVASFANIIMPLAFMGLFSISSRELTNRTPEQTQKIYRSIYSLSIILSIVICSGAAFVAWLLGSFPDQQFLIMLLCMFTLVVSYAPVIPTESLMIVRGDGWRAAFIQGAYALWTSLAGILILLMGGGVGALYIAFTLLSIVEISWYALESRRYIAGGQKFTFRPKEWIYYLTQGIPGGLGTFFYLITRSVGIFLVYTFIDGGDVLAGHIYLAYTLMLAVTQVVWVPYSMSIVPVLVSLQSHSRERLGWLGSRSVTWLLAITIPICVGVFLLAPDILRVLGESKVVAAPTLRIFIWLLPLSVIVEFFMQMLIALKRQRMFVIAAGLGSIINIGLCFALLPVLGVEGVAWASFIGTTIVAMICVIRVREWITPQLRPLDLLRLTVAVLVMVIAIEFTPNWSVFLRIALASIAYIMTAIVSGLFRYNDWNTAKSLLNVPNLPATGPLPRFTGSGD